MKKLMTMLLGFGLIATLCGLGMSFGPHVLADNERPKPRRQPPAAAERTSSKMAIGLQAPARVKPGDTLGIEVLEALPGRPISGQRYVRPDGTITLGFYGDLEVAGLNRHEIKERLVEHLGKFISDDYLGLWRLDPGDLENPDDDKQVPVAPRDSDRVYVDDTLIYTTPPASPVAATDAPAKVQPGDRLLIEVFKTLPGRPISGSYMIRPDGTISLGFYGDLQVAGLNRREIKEKIVGHLRKVLSQEDLGLTRKDPKSGQQVKLAPADADHVFVDEIIHYEVAARKQAAGGTGEKLDRILQSLDELRSPNRASYRPTSEIAQRLGDHDRRLGEIESKLERLIQAIEGLK